MADDRSIWRRWLDALTPTRDTPALPAPRRRRYEGASTGRLTADWYATGSGANVEIGAALSTLRQRSRDLVRNNPLASRGVTVLVNALVGDGIRPQPATGRTELDEALLDVWASLGLDIDAAGRCDAYGLQRLAVQGWMESGEALLRRRWRRIEDGLAVPMQVQVLEGDMIADDISPVSMRDPSAARLQYGIEVDAIGRRTAYRLWRAHPGETLIGAGIEAAMVPASEVSHVYLPTRPGQLRGVPVLSSAMLELRDLDDLEHAEITRQKMQACVAGVITTDADDPTELGAAAQDTDEYDGDWVVDLRPGTVQRARPGEQVQFLSPQQAGGFSETATHYQRLIAIGIHVPYEWLTGDLSSTNFASVRAGALEFRRHVSALTRQVVILHVCEPMWRWVVEAAEVAGLLPRMTDTERARAMRPRWHPPAWIQIDREAEVKADILEMQAGTRTLAQAVAERGGDWRATLAQLAAERDEAEALGLGLSGFGSVSPSQAVTMPDDDETTAPSRASGPRAA